MHDQRVKKQLFLLSEIFDTNSKPTSPLAVQDSYNPDSPLSSIEDDSIEADVQRVAGEPSPSKQDQR